ncbi:MAG: tRNA pseudouridine(55) synthase TruB [Polyangia bacterium]|nr:tRNA pseudouridine(55) synthase TruB [Polyangia bacterium]
MNGILLVDKPQGITSHGVVASVRRLLGTRKVGHTGTLDPLATGLLPILVGEATRLSAWVSDSDKEYLATAHLGVTTDTLDADGATLVTRPLPTGEALEPSRIEALLEGFVGPQTQRVPRYSAVKVQGRALHARARAGESPLDVPPRQITIYALELTSLDPPRLTLRVHCSKGTYVRQLVSDLGESIGCGAHLVALRRTRVGSLDVEDATPLSTIEAAPDSARGKLITVADWLGGVMPSVTCDHDAAARTRQGQRLPWSRFGSPKLPQGARFIIVSGGHVVALAELFTPWSESPGPCYRLLRVFSPSGDAEDGGERLDP